MRPLAILIVTTGLFAQEDVERVLHFAATETAQNIQEVTTTIRSVAGIRQATADVAEKTVALRGTASQITIAEWVFDSLTQQDQNQAMREYRVLPGGDDIVRVFFLTHTGTPQELQEVAVQVRTTTEVRRLFTYNAPRAMAVRGTADQIAMAERLIKERNK